MGANKKVTGEKIQINWEAVFEARKRGKSGCATPADHDLCDAAYKADPVKYREVSNRAVKEAIKDANPWNAWHEASKKG